MLAKQVEKWEKKKNLLMAGSPLQQFHKTVKGG